MAQAIDISRRRAIRVELDRYLASNWFVFPVYEIDGGKCACNVECNSPGKHPRLNPGYKASNEPRIAHGWWEKYPFANIGIYPGLSRLCVLDIDPRNGGDESLIALERSIGELPETVQAFTGGGGWHYYFKRPAEREKMPSREIAPGVEFKGDAGYIIAPPSIHYSGRQYAWESGHHPDETEISLLPQGLFDLVEDTSKTRPLPSDPRGPMAGILGAAFASAGLMGKQLGRDRAAVQCPWQHEHTTGKKLDSSSIVFAPSIGRKLGWFHCSHAHCDKRRTPQEVLDALPPAAVEQAKKLLGADLDYRSSDQRPLAIEPEEPARRPAGEKDWKKLLTFNSKTLQLQATAGNVALVLAFSDLWKGCLVSDRFSHTDRWVRDPPELGGLGPSTGSEVHDSDAVYVAQWFSLERGITIPLTTVREGIGRALELNATDTLRAWVESLQWDGRPRISSWLTDYLGAESGKHVSFVSSAWLISAIARALDPGCQVDHMLVLEGPQGNGKTSALEILAGPDRLLRSLPDLHNADARRSLFGKWIVNLEELDSLRRNEWSAIKAFITDRQDTFREPYARRTITRPRRCIFSGTTNPQKGRGYLTDPTGARRFWPIKCGDIDLDGLRSVRDQLWAEAVVAYRQGTKWHPHTKALVQSLSDEQSKRADEPDPWEDSIIPTLDRDPSREWRMGDLLAALNVPLDRQDTRCSMRVARLIRNYGYEKRHTVGGNVWFRESPPPAVETEPASGLFEAYQ